MMLMISLALLAILIFSLYYYLRVYRKKILMKNMSLAVDLVKVGLFGRLVKNIEPDYGREKAGLMAAAITNELFFDRPTGPEGQEFLIANEDSVWQEIAVLMEDEAIRSIISQAIRVKATLSYAQSSQVDYEFLLHVAKLNEFGWKMPSEAPSPETFLPEAHYFYNSK